MTLLLSKESLDPPNHCCCCLILTIPGLRTCDQTWPFWEASPLDLRLWHKSVLNRSPPTPLLSKSTSLTLLPDSEQLKHQRLSVDEVRLRLQKRLCRLPRNAKSDWLSLIAFWPSPKLESSCFRSLRLEPLCILALQKFQQNLCRQCHLHSDPFVILCANLPVRERKFFPKEPFSKL